MANFTAGTSFTDGVTNDVTAAKLNALVADAVPTANLSLNSTTGTVSNFTTSTATINGPITASTAVINVGSGQIYKDASGNVGIGTASPTQKLTVSGNVSISGQTASDVRYTFDALSYAGAAIGINNSGSTNIYGAPTGVGYFGIAQSYPLVFTVGTERLRIDSSGNVGIGITNPSYKLHASGSAAKFAVSGTSYSSLIRLDTDVDNQKKSCITDNIGDRAIVFDNTSSGYTQFYTNGTERLRIDSSGNVLIGATNSGQTTGVGLKLKAGDLNVSAVAIVYDTAGNKEAYTLYNANATNNGYRFYVSANGGISNFSANNTNLSDERLKTNIEIAGNYLDKICSIQVKTFNYKDQGEDTEKTIGIIAQEVEAVIPELINNDGFGETPEDGIPLKTIYQTDLQYVLMRCIQELSAKVTALEAA